MTKKQKPTHRTLTMMWSLLIRLISFITLGLIFYLIVTPIGLLMRIMGRDSMRLSDMANKKTCRVRSKVRNSKHLEKPY